MKRPRILHGVGGLAALVALVALAGACSTPGVIPPLPPAPSVPVTTTTVAVDYSGVGLEAVPGLTTTTVPFGPGRAILAGKVTGPDGFVAGAVVHAERLVGDASATMEVVTGPDGGFEMAGVLGGRYRVRAWKPAPDNLALIEPQVFFLEGSEGRIITLGLSLYSGVTVTAAMAPVPVVGGAANLVVQVVNQEVDARGVVRSSPVAGVAGQLMANPDWRVASTNPAAADSGGRLRWQVECRRPGAQPLTVVVTETSAFSLNLPPCAPPPTTTTTTTTTAPEPARSTTTTVRSTPTTAR